MQTRALNWLASFTTTREVDWEAVYREELPRIYNFFRYRVYDEALAEDLTSITFEKAWRARERYRRDLAAFSTWLFAIARNVAAEHFRRQQREVSWEDISDAIDSATPEVAALQDAELKHLAILLAKLDERERELLALKYGAELSNRAIARVTGLSESNVGTILHRTILRLRAQW
jgi:RNA polymerase sigma-70 factor (ECF subfamily)